MDIEVRPLEESDLDHADRIFREAFGAFLGADMFGDTDLVRTRFRAGHTAVLGAFRDGELVGSNVATRWGSVGYFGPLSVTPALWDGGVGAQLVEATMEVFAGWGTTHHGLFTFANSPKHHGLYQKFGFWPRHLTAIMSRPVTGDEPATGTLLSRAADRSAVVAACAGLTDGLYPGFEVTGEIDAVLDHKLGDVVLVGDPAAPDAFAVCHTGPGTEAGTGVTYVKVAAVRAGAGVPAFTALLSAVQGQAAAVGAGRLALGVNTARHDAYRHLLGAGFRTDLPGVTMHSPNGPGYDHPDAYVLDDWR
jgi:GNAT superfamily N-acetyltransferase